MLIHIVRKSTLYARDFDTLIKFLSLAHRHHQKECTGVNKACYELKSLQTMPSDGKTGKLTLECTVKFGEKKEKENGK